MDIVFIIKKILTEPDGIKKLLITGAISLIPIFGALYLLGWVCAVTERADGGYSSVLPELNIPGCLKDGALLALGFLTYNLPILVLYGLKRLLEFCFTHWVPSGAGKVLCGILNGLSAVIGTLWLFLFLFLVPVLIHLFIRRHDFRDIVDFGRVYRFCVKHVHELLSPLAMLCVVLTTAASGFSLLMVGILLTIPLSFAFYGYRIGRQELFLQL